MLKKTGQTNPPFQGGYVNTFMIGYDIKYEKHNNSCSTLQQGSKHLYNYAWNYYLRIQFDKFINTLNQERGSNGKM